MQLPGAALQFIRNIPIYGPRLYEVLDAVQQQTTRIETQGNLNATGDPPTPPPPDALNVTNGPSGEFQIAITHNGEFNRGTTFHTQWDTSPHFTNPHNIDHGSSRNDSSLNLPGQTVYFRSSAASPSGANSAWTYNGSQSRPIPVTGGVRGIRAPGMGSGTSAPGDQTGGPGIIQERNSQAGYNWKAQQRKTSAGSGTVSPGSPTGFGAPGTGGGGGVVTSGPFFDTYANWTLANYDPSTYPINTTFTITDWNFVTYIVRSVSGSNAWVYQSGEYSVTQSAIAGLTGFNGGALGRNDTGLKLDVTDYDHVLGWSSSVVSTAIWAGGTATIAIGAHQFFIGQSVSISSIVPSGYNSASVVITGSSSTTISYAVVSNPGSYVSGGLVSGFIWGPGELGSAYFQDFAIAPTGVGWQICDGSAGVKYLKADGSTGTLTVPASSSNANYRNLTGNYSAVITAAAVPIISGVTEDTTIGYTDPAAPSTLAGAPTGIGDVTVLTPVINGGGLGTDPHNHALTSGNAPISLGGGDPVAHHKAMEFFRQ